MNLTVPAGMPAEDVTVAVNVTACLYAEGFTDETNAVVVGASAIFTTWVRVTELLLV